MKPAKFSRIVFSQFPGFTSLLTHVFDRNPIRRKNLIIVNPSTHKQIKQTNKQNREDTNKATLLKDLLKNKGILQKKDYDYIVKSVSKNNIIHADTV